jgi:hypothetical protein
VRHRHEALRHRQEHSGTVTEQCGTITGHGGAINTEQCGTVAEQCGTVAEQCGEPRIKRFARQRRIVAEQQLEQPLGHGVAPTGRLKSDPAVQPVGAGGPVQDAGMPGRDRWPSLLGHRSFASGA